MNPVEKGINTHGYMHTSRGGEYLFWHIFIHVIAAITSWVNETIVKIISCLL